MKQKNKTRRVCGGFLGLYGLVMVYLMFLQRVPADDYWAFVKGGYNLVPLRTLGQMLNLLAQDRQMAWFSVVNLLGNVIMFLPLGLLPAVWKRQRDFGVFLLTVAGLILAAELLQLFTTLGTADVDDLLLNVPGACIGYGIWKIFRKKKEPAR